jgi:iron complex outermembrane recepter protein
MSKSRAPMVLPITSEGEVHRSASKPETSETNKNRGDNMNTKHRGRGEPLRAALSAIAAAIASAMASTAGAQTPTDAAAAPSTAASAATPPSTVTPGATPPSAVASAPATAPSEQLQQVVVTATRRQQRLQDTPIAITVLDAKTLVQSGAADLVDVARIAPNVDLSAGGGGSGGSFNTQAYIRGVGQSDWLITTDPGVGVYIDGVFFPRATGALLDLLDIARVEVLRGPQGTLFGRNTIGGAISIVTARPTGEPGGQVEGTIGNYARREFKGYADLPFSDTVQTRVSMAYKKADGFVDRVLAGDRLGGIDSLVARARTTWQISPAVELDFSIDGTRKRDDSVAQYTPRVQTSGNLYPLWSAVAQPVINRPPGSTGIDTFLAASGNAGAVANPGTPLQSTATGPNIGELDMGGLAATLTWDISRDLQFKSISAWRGFNSTFGRDGDNSPVQYIATLQNVKQRQFSQELQLLGNALDNRLRWVGGLYFFNERASDRNDVKLASGLFAGLETLPGAVVPLAPGVICPPPPGVLAPCAGGAGNPINTLFDLDFDVFNRIKTKSYAGFAHSTFSASERWDVVLGARYTNDDKEYFLAHNRVNAGVPLIPPTTVTRKDNNFSPKLGLNYKVSTGTLLYASFGKGFKSGGFNGRPTTEAEVQSFGPEQVTSYEIGAKNEFLDRRVRLNAALFSNRYSDIQLSSVQADATNNLVLVIENAGQARMNGAEIELQARPATGWQFDLSLGFLDARFTRLAPGASVTLDSKLPRTPRWTAAVGSSYTFGLGGSGMQLTLRGDASYRSDSFTNTENTPELMQPAYSLLSARAVLTRSGGPWTLSAHVTNLTDKRYIVGGVQALSSFGQIEAVLGRPREWGLSFGYAF